MLSDLCEHVTVIQNLDTLTGEARLAEQLRAKANVDILLGTVVKGYLGDGELTGVAVQQTDGTERELLLDGLFVAIGLVPQNEPFASLIDVDGRGYAVADETTLTKTRGVFVAGDCRTKAIRQVATAAADGAVAALAACRYIDDLNA